MKNAVMTLATEAALLTPDNPKVAAAIFKEILEKIRRVKVRTPSRLKLYGVEQNLIIDYNR